MDERGRGAEPGGATMSGATELSTLRDQLRLVVRHKNWMIEHLARLERAAVFVVEAPAENMRALNLQQATTRAMAVGEVREVLAAMAEDAGEGPNGGTERPAEFDPDRRLRP